MDLETHSTSASAATFDAPPCSPSIIAADADVFEFVSANGLQAEYDFVLERLMSLLAPGKLTVLVLRGQEEDSADHLAFLVQCEMDQRSFRAACDRFYEPLRNDGSAIYTRMSVQRDI